MKSQNFIVIVIVILVGANLLAWIAVFELAKPQYLEVTFFDVGQGDSVFIETPQRHQILIDGGPTSAVLKSLGKEMPFWDRTIDLIILTHPERDHLAGLIEVLRRYEVENVLWTGVARNGAEYLAWTAELGKEQKNGTRVFAARKGQMITCFNSGASPSVLLRASPNAPANKKCSWRMEILNPAENLYGRKVQRSNNTSIVGRLLFGKTAFLFTGDIEAKTEKALAENPSEVSADVLKVAHHGSRTSTAKEFVEAVSPDVAVISAGRDNSYGHPHRQTLETLEGYGAKILRTDLLGDIKITSDGANYQIRR